MGCLLSTGKLVTSCLQESVTSTWFYAYLTGIAQQVKQTYNLPLVLIVDNASIHRSKKMADYRELLKSNFSTNLYFIPAYSPELNRIEMVWKQWTAPSILDMRPPHFEAVSNASGLIPSRCE